MVEPRQWDRDMTAEIIDGKAFAADVREKVAGHVARLKADHERVRALKAQSD